MQTRGKSFIEGVGDSKAEFKLMECAVSLSGTIPMCSRFQSKLNVGQKINSIVLIHRCSEKTQTKTKKNEWRGQQCKQKASENTPRRGILLTGIRTYRDLLLHNFHEIISNIFFPKKHERCDSDVRVQKYYKTTEGEKN